MTTGERFTVELEPVAGGSWAGAPPAVRLRRALKSLLRSHGLRCVACKMMASTGPLLDPRATEGQGGQTAVAAEDLEARYRREAAAAQFSSPSEAL